MICIVASEKDVAGSNMWKILLERGEETGRTFDGNPVYKVENRFLVKSKRDVIHSNHVSDLEADAYIFASRHSSRSKRPCLTAHATGNFGTAKYGGNQRELSMCSSALIGSAVRNMHSQGLEGFEVTMEATHHGPTSIGKPIVFVEVGSSEQEWNNLEACRVVAETAVNLEEGGKMSAIGFGGGHYASSFKEMVVDGWNIGHLCPKYNLKNLDKELFTQMVEKTVPRPGAAVLDSEGMNSKQKRMVKGFADDLGLEVVMV